MTKTRKPYDSYTREFKLEAVLHRSSARAQGLHDPHNPSTG